MIVVCCSKCGSAKVHISKKSGHDFFCDSCEQYLYFYEINIVEIDFSVEGIYGYEPNNTSQKLGKLPNPTK